MNKIITINNEKKNLLIAVDTFHPKRDGVLIFLEKIILPLAKEYNLSIVAPRFSKEIEPIENVNLILIDTCKFIKISGYPSAKISRKNMAKIKKAVMGADIVWSQDLAPIGALAILYSKRYNKPIVNYVHQITWEQFAEILPIPEFIKKLLAAFVRKLVRYLYGKCDLLMIPYNSLGEELREKNIKSPVEIVTLGVNTNKLMPVEDKNSAKAALGIPPEIKVIGYCGRISREKDLLTLKKAFIRLKQKYKDIIVLMVGGGLENEVEELTKEKGIKVTGFVNDVLPYLQAMDIFVMPSLTETTSLATIEAMSVGLPVIATKVGYMKEYIKNRENGLVFTPGNDYLLSKKIELLIEDPHLAKNIAKKARETAVLKFSWASTILRIKEVLEKLS